MRKTIHWGMPTLLETNTLSECAGICKSLGLDFIELNMNLPRYQPNKLEISSLDYLAKKFGIYYTLHLDENINIADFNPYVAQAYMLGVHDAITVAKSLSIPVLNMHMSKGVHFTMPNGKVFLFEAYKEQYLNNIIQFRNTCQERIGSSNVKICIENTDGFTPFQQEAIELLLESPVFGLTFDIGHNHVIGGADEAFIRKHLSRLHHMHVHDAAGTADHLVLGTGEIELDRYLDLAEQQQCRIVLETKTVDALWKSAQWLKDTESK